MFQLFIHLIEDILISEKIIRTLFSSPVYAKLYCSFGRFNLSLSKDVDNLNEENSTKINKILN